MVALCVGSRSPGSAARGHSSAAGDERHDDVGGVAVEVLAATVVDRGGSGGGVAGGELQVAERDAGVEGGHDERRSNGVLASQGPLRFKTRHSRERHPVLPSGTM